MQANINNPTARGMSPAMSAGPSFSLGGLPREYRSRMQSMALQRKSSVFAAIAELPAARSFNVTRESEENWEARHSTTQHDPTLSRNKSPPRSQRSRDVFPPVAFQVWMLHHCNVTELHSLVAMLLSCSELIALSLCKR